MRETLSAGFRVRAEQKMTMRLEQHLVSRTRNRLREFRTRIDTINTDKHVGVEHLLTCVGLERSGANISLGAGMQFVGIQVVVDRAKDGIDSRSLRLDRFVRLEAGLAERCALHGAVELLLGRARAVVGGVQEQHCSSGVRCLFKADRSSAAACGTS